MVIVLDFVVPAKNVSSLQTCWYRYWYRPLLCSMVLLR